MKTVSGKIQSCTPVTISTAASVLSKFVSAETGASQAVNAYLRRATASLDELLRLHSKSDRKKHKNYKSESSAVTANVEIPTGSIGLIQDPTGIENGTKRVDSGNTLLIKVEEEKIRREGNVLEDNERMKIKKEKSGDFDQDRVGIHIKEEKVHAESKLGEESEKKKHKKKRKNGDYLGDAEVNGVGTRNRETENKRDIKEEEKKVDNTDEHNENGLKMEVGEVKKEDRKKRKNREVEQGSRNEAEEEEEQRSKKMKKTRIGGEDHN